MRFCIRSSASAFIHIVVRMIPPNARRVRIGQYRFARNDKMRGQIVIACHAPEAVEPHNNKALTGRDIRRYNVYNCGGL
jgi:hypothetical protein